MSTKAKTPPKYAEGTEVTVEKSRAELEALLMKHGAKEFALYRNEEFMRVQFRMADRLVRHDVRAPVRKSYELVPGSSWKKRAESDVTRLVDAEHRRRWRVCVLIIKAKLEIVASGESTFEREFLADIMLADGSTVGEVAIPRIAQSYQSGEMPRLLLGSGS